jgi:hypothetical protein
LQNYFQDEPQTPTILSDKEIAQLLIQDWRLDEDCHKSMIILLPSQDIDSMVEYHYKQVPVLTEEMEHLFHLEVSTYASTYAF